LGLMDRGYPVNGLDLNNYRVFHDQVHPILLEVVDYAKFSKIPAAPMPPPTHIVTMP
jgi:hypothetical protein